MARQEDRTIRMMEWVTSPSRPAVSYFLRAPRSQSVPAGSNGSRHAQSPVPAFVTGQNQSAMLCS
jgi:hypothetical protein